MLDEGCVLYLCWEARLNAVQWLGIDTVNIFALLPCRVDGID